MFVRYIVNDIKYEDGDADPIEEQVREDISDQFDFGCAIVDFKSERDPDQTGVPN